MVCMWIQEARQAGRYGMGRWRGKHTATGWAAGEASTPLRQGITEYESASFPVLHWIGLILFGKSGRIQF
jgi:hypothetical protein